MVTSSHSRPGTSSPAGSTPQGHGPDGSHKTDRSAPSAPTRPVRQRAAIWSSDWSSDVCSSDLALNGETSPLNAKNWPTADNGKLNIIPTMLKALMQGAPFDSTVAAANTQLASVLNTGS